MRLSRRLEEFQAAVEAEMAALRAEVNGLLSEIRMLAPDSLDTISREERLLPPIPIPDERLRRVWLVLYRYPLGATADVVARDLDRHRTTISTYLNTLVLMGFAEKKRRGHEILYTAIVKIDHAES